MKKLITYILLITTLATVTKNAHAQAWDKSSTVLTIGVSLSQFYHLDDYYYTKNDSRRGYKLLTEQFIFQGEFGIHKYVGLGFLVGVGGRGGLSNNYNGELNIPVGLVSNFHFYQLIADNSKKNIHADKTDIYAGINIGSGVAFTYYTNSTRIVPLLFGGLHAGIRYYISPKFALNAEAGMGKSMVNAGFSFKL
jgi:hypothetical protein